MPDDPRPGSSVKSLLVALDILEAIAESRTDTGISELAGTLGLTKGSVFRYVKTLSERGYLSQDPATLRYRPGLRLHVLGELAAGRHDLLAAAEPVMRQLRDALSLTVNLAGIGRGGVVVLKSLVGPGVMEIGVRVGTEMPLGTTSQGRVIMAFGQQSLLARARRETPPRSTEHTVTDIAGIERRVALARERGWAAAPEETTVGINGVSAPLLDANGGCEAALTLVGSLQFLPAVPHPAQVTALRQAAGRISLGLGYRGIYPGRDLP